MSLTVFSFVASLIAFINVTSAAKTATVTSTGSCPSLSPFEQVTVLNTTNAAGATVLTTETVAEQSAGASVSVFTSTDSAGQTVVGSTTIEPVSLSSQTNISGGSAAASSGASLGLTSSAAGSAAATTPVSPAASPSAPCPQAAFAQIYNSKAGAVWQIFCSADVYYYDLPSVTTASFEDCINACDAWQPSGAFNYPCVAVSWTEPTGGPATNCQLKYGVSQVVYGTSKYCSAKLASYVLPPDFPVSVVPSHASQAVPTTATTTLRFPTGTQVQSYETASPCPLTNNSMYTPPDGSGITYEVFCGVSFQYDDLPSIVVGSFEDCMAACNSWVPAPAGDPYDQPCVAVTYIGYNPQLPSCFRHYATNKNYIVNNHPYGDSAVRKDKIPSLGTSDRKLERRDLLDVANINESWKVLPEELIEARTMLAEQGISLEVLS